MIKTYIGLVGEAGSGKGTFVKIMQEITALTPTITLGHIKFSGILMETAERWNLPINRETLQKIPQAMREKFGANVLSRAIEHEALTLNKKMIILDGIRWETDVKMLQTLPNNILIYLTAEEKIRFERLKKRGERSGETTMTFEQFREEGRAVNEILIPHIGKNWAHIRIENNGTIEEFEKKTKEFYDTVIKNGN